MTRRLLYLVNGPVRRAVSRLDERFESWGLQVDRHWAYSGEFPERLSSYAGVFLSGSPHSAYENVPFVQREHTLIQEAAQLEIPMLGICFGSQILASALCGRDQVIRRAFCEVGFKWLEVSAVAASDPIANAIGPRVHMFVWHNDEVRATHPDVTVLASSDLCSNHIWRFGSKPVWGIQGHPEITVEQSRVWFAQARERLEADGANIDELNRTAAEAHQAKTMLRRFAECCLH